METTAPRSPSPTVTAPATAPDAVTLARYAGLRADGPLFRPMAALAAELRSLGVDVVAETGLPSAAPLAARCRAALQADVARTVLHLAAAGPWSARADVRLGTLPTQPGPHDARAADRLAPGLLVLGGAWSAVPADLFEPGTLVLGSDAAVTKHEIARVVRPVVLAGIGLPAADAREAMAAALAAVQHDGVAGGWALRTAAEAGSEE
jgi:hypothetical protein